MSSIHVLKFGGTSLRDTALINQAADIISQRQAGAAPVVIVSAVAGVTDRLLELANSNPTDAQHLIRQLEKRHLQLFDEVSAGGSSSETLASLFEELRTAYANAEKRAASPKAWCDQLLSFGERASVQLIEAALQKRGIRAHRFEAQHFITTDASFGEANVLAEPTKIRIRQSLEGRDEVPVITGFIGSTQEGIITTLGRSGSDYTASLVAGALCAELLEIWTDVDGILTADPQIVPAAHTIETLNYDDIAELSAHGARVIHPKTIDPLRDCGIPMQVRNSLNPTHPGTKISETFASNGHFRSVTVTGPFAHLQIRGSNYSFFLNWLNEQIPAIGIDKIGIFRPSSAESAQFIIPDDIYQPIKPELQQWLSDHDMDAEITENLYQVKKFTNALLEDDQSITSVLQALSRQKIHPLQWHRGYNRRHVSLLLPEKEAHRAAQIINEEINGTAGTLDLFVAGTGAVGGTLIQQLKKVNQPDINLHLAGSCDAKTVQWFTPSNEEGQKQATDWPAIIERLTEKHHRPTIFVDATGSEEVARLYPQLFEAGLHIVTPSKLANTFEQSYYDELRSMAEKNDAQFRYETTVGAGLPMISTISNLRKTGDTITEISGVVSGTMTFLFNQLENGVPFSEAIVDAREKGYAEPDPRDDLSGEDVARKFLTLARESGLKIERSELQVESLIPQALTSVDKDTFLKRLPDFDDYWLDKLAQARQNKATLCYSGQLVDGVISIGVQQVSSDSPLGQLEGTDNFIRIFTKRYHETPLIIQGPGAGKEVTAAGVLADVLEVAASVE